MKILSAEQTKALDNYTIKNEPISSIELMERASMVFVEWFTKAYDNQSQSILIFCGPGNNGGDGLVIGRLLHHSFYTVHIYCCKIGNQHSEDYKKSLHRLPKHQAISVFEINEEDAFPEIPEHSIIIDGIFGSGLNRPLEGYWANLINHLNKQQATRIAIDIPSGLFADRSTESIAFKADQTFSFQLPKLAFLFPENHPYVGQWNFGNIGLLQTGIDELKSNNFFIDSTLAKSFYKKRNKYDHKGTFGHTLLIAGSYGMIGAAILCAKAAFRTGAGLVTLHVPKIAYAIIQSALPEAIISIDKEEQYISDLPELSKFNGIGIGPGISTNSLTVKSLDIFLKSYTSPLVIDADGLNIIAKNKDLLNKIPKGSILTPHPKEFERLFGKSDNDFQKNELQRTKSKELGLYIILKGAHTCVACPDGSCYFNSTGNPGMATAGSGDVLTGIITSLIAQGYEPKAAAILGVYLHGLAGDIALKKVGSEEALMAGDVVEGIGFAFGRIWD